MDSDDGVQFSVGGHPNRPDDPEQEMEMNNMPAEKPTTPTTPTRSNSKPVLGGGIRRGSLAAMNAAMMQQQAQQAQQQQTPLPRNASDKDFFDNKWHRNYQGRVSGADLEALEDGERVNTGVEADGSTDDVNRPRLHIQIPDRMANGPESASSETESVVMRTPAERVRQILSEVDDDVEVKGTIDVMSGLSLHALFCQMDMLCHFDDGNMGWKECARWLKYEEKVDSSDRWSKPHVATTSLHALFELRSALAVNTCTVIMDMDANHGCMTQVAELITRHVRAERGLDEKQARAMVDVLLKPHKHKHRKAMDKKQIKQKAKEVGTPTENANETILSQVKLIPEEERDKKKKSMFSKDSSEISALKHQYPGSIRPEHLKDHKPNKRLMGKMPGGSEAANILIGQVDFLEEPIMAFVRLRNSAVLADMTEITVPTRFLFIVLGPPYAINVWEYEEVGRAAAALFTDRVFCEVAYKATSRQDLVDGVDEFIDDLTVLPPSIWDPSIRLQPPEQSMSMDKIKKRLQVTDRHAMGMEDCHIDNVGSDPTLERGNVPFGGLWKDIKRRYPLYWSDIKDGLHPQCLASIVFLYFACITPIVTFGGLMGGATENFMGTMETLLSGALCGTIYHAFAGQPLSIVGATGPMLIFEGILYVFCKEYGIDYPSFRFFLGIWTSIYLLIFVCFDLSSLVRYITRFTEESFSVLISIIFIFEAFKKLASVWKSHPVHVHAGVDYPDYTCHCVYPELENTTMTSPLYPATTPYMDENSTMIYEATTPVLYEMYNWTQEIGENCVTYLGRLVVDSDCVSEKRCLANGWELVGSACGVKTVTHAVPDVFFLSCFLFLGTFGIAYVLKGFRTSVFFPSIIRSTVSDFAVLIAIIICTGTDYLLKLDTPKLEVPTKFETTIPGRGWLVNPFNIGSWYLALLAAIPALLATILVFLDQQITAVIVNRKEHKLKKGHGYHLDLFVLCILIALCSLLGLPWFVAATVRAINHVRSLMRESELRVPGERPQFLGVREQRVTGVVVHILIGLSVFLTRILRFVPMPVLFGVFLYMGVTSLKGVQFIDRIQILFMPAKYQPDHIYLRHVETKRVHIFTCIQMTLMAMMWIVKSTKSIAIGFPVLILALCFVRKAMDFIFTRRELFWLDHLLPEATRKAREDKKLKGGMYDDDEDGDGNGQDEMVVEGEWDQMLAKRDYGVGRKERNREKSQNVISRYHKHDEADNDKENAKRKPLLGMSFKDRKFDM